MTRASFPFRTPGHVRRPKVALLTGSMPEYEYEPRHLRAPDAINHMISDHAPWTTAEFKLKQQCQVALNGEPANRFAVRQRTD